jgi:hypothetical protein
VLYRDAVASGINRDDECVLCRRLPVERISLTVDPQHPDQLRLNLQGKDVGEFRGFSGDGREAYYVGYPFEACNLDVFAIDLASGKVRRLTSHPEYVDPWIPPRMASGS